MDQDIKRAFEDSVIRLISRAPFFAHLLLQMKIQFTKRLPTAGVGVRNDCLNLYINPDFYTALSNDKQVFVLKHEMAHIVLGHLGEERRGSAEDSKIMNLAMDTAIHEILSESKTLFNKDDDFSPITVDSIKKLTKIDDIKNNETTEYYYNFLKQLKEEMLEKFKDFDSHEFNDGDPVDPDLAKALTVGALQRACDNAGPGNTPGEALITLDKLKKQTINWRAALRRYVASQVDTEYRNTRNKRNRRYGFMVPGRKHKFHPKVVAIVDTSGSMGIEQLNAVWAELAKMEKQGYEIHVVEADADVQKSYPFNSKKTVSFSGRGGTLYQPALDAAMKHNPDCIIYLTDLDPADSAMKPKSPVIWADCNEGRGSFKPEFGHIIQISVK